MAQPESPSRLVTKPLSTLNTRSLKIHPTPFKPSNLSIPPSRFSPRVPITPPLAPLNSNSFIFSTSLPTTTSLAPPPPSPLQWLWQCHQCHRKYPLGVTRRCLDDGHFFCAGTTTVKSWRKAKSPRRVKRHRACASEFDYQGWKSRGKWRRNEQDDFAADSSSSDPDNKTAASSASGDEADGKKHDAKDCWHACDYPSECRWRKRFRLQMPSMPDAPLIPLCPLPPPPPATSFEGILQAQEPSEGGAKRGAKSDFWGALLASATSAMGRKNAGAAPSSPLPLDPVQEELEGEEAVVVAPSPAVLPASSALVAVASTATCISIT